MAIVIENSTLNEQQLDMLKLFANPLPEPYFNQIRRLAVQLMAQQLDNVVGEWEEQNSITNETYQTLLNQHFHPSKK